MIKQLTIALGALTLTVPGLAAAELNYNWVEVGHEWIDVTLDTNGTEIEEDGDGFRVSGSIDISSQFSLRADYRDIETENNGTTVSDGDGHLLSIGPSVRHAITDNLHAQATLTYEESDFKFSNSRSDVDGYGLSVGVRGAPCKGSELNADVTYIDYGDSTGTRMRFGVLKHLGSGFAGALRYEINRFEGANDSPTDTDFGTFVVGVRWSP